MTDEDREPSLPYDPSTMIGNLPDAPVRLPWYRRPWVLAMIGVVVVVGASVAVDLPRNTTIPDDVAAQTTLMNQINTDIAPCGFAVQESFSLYTDMKAGSLTPSDRVRVPALLRDDQTACSFTSSPIFELSSIQPSGTTAGKSIGQVVSQVTLWATSDALSAIEDIQSIYSGTDNAATVADLSKQERLLAADRASAITDDQTAERILNGARLPAPNLPALPHLTGTT